MESSTYAVEPLPSGPPWRRWAEVGADAAARQGVFAPVYSVSFGARNRIVIAPGDSRSMTLIPEKCEGYCQGVDGRAGPNLACGGCGRAVATRMDDCGMWQTVWLEPDAVTRRSSGLPAGPPPDWDDLARADHRVPPVEADGSWSRRWEAALGVALAHLVAVTGDRPVSLPAGPVAELLGHAVGRYLPSGPDARSRRLAGPGTRSVGPTNSEASSVGPARPDAPSPRLVEPGTRPAGPPHPEASSVGPARPDAPSPRLVEPGTRSAGPPHPEASSVGLAGSDARSGDLAGSDAWSEGLTGPGPGSGPWSVGLAGPGVHPPQPRPDILLVPRHPLTGEPWRPPGDEGVVVPLDSGVWAFLARPGETSPLPATGGLPEGVLRDDYPLLPRPWCPLRPHHRAFEDTLVRLPAIRAPRLHRYRAAFHRAVSPTPL
ncbi:hypothetical protein [Streptomyces sp. cg40]|uniref:hypothetical protein n=1 Tax=Streptomyces sp. cg40 TaxID=3419764 RepID=UPI003D0445A2